MTLTHEAAALEHYLAMIAERYPPQLAAALAAERYGLGLRPVDLPLPTLAEALVQVAEEHPDLRRDIGRTLAAIERRRAA